MKCASAWCLAIYVERFADENSAILLWEQVCVEVEAIQHLNSRELDYSHRYEL